MQWTDEVLGRFIAFLKKKNDGKHGTQAQTARLNLYMAADHWNKNVPVTVLQKKISVLKKQGCVFVNAGNSCGWHLQSEPATPLRPREKSGQTLTPIPFGYVTPL